MNDSVPISVIVPTLNEENYLGALLRSLAPQLKRGDELIIVDSHSTDKTVKIAKKYTKKIFFMPRLGIGPAKTYGARRAKNAIVAFLDADSTVNEGWLERTRAAFADGADVFYGLAFFTSASKAQEVLYNAGSRLVYAMSGVICAVTGVLWVPPNNCAFRRSVFLKAGGYRGVVCEDWDLAVRFRGMAGVRYRYDSGSVVLMSDRRFRKNGFFRTVAEWAFHALSILTRGPTASSRQYGVVR